MTRCKVIATSTTAYSRKGGPHAPAKSGRDLWAGFGAYSAIGLGNMVIHSQLFLTLNVALDMTKAQSNALACCASAWLAFYANALFTFKHFITTSGFLVFMVCIGGLSYAMGSARAIAWSCQRRRR